MLQHVAQEAQHDRSAIDAHQCVAGAQSLGLRPPLRPVLRAAEPMLRAVPDAETVANILAKALATTGGTAVRDGVKTALARQSLGQEAALA